MNSLLFKKEAFRPVRMLMKKIKKLKNFSPMLVITNKAKPSVAISTYDILHKPARRFLTGKKMHLNQIAHRDIIQVAIDNKLESELEVQKNGQEVR